MSLFKCSYCNTAIVVLKSKQKNKLIWKKKSSTHFTLFVVSEKVVNAVMSVSVLKTRHPAFRVR